MTSYNEEQGHNCYCGGCPDCEPTGDPSPCELGEHPDTENGRCLLCGEWVFPFDDPR